MFNTKAIITGGRRHQPVRAINKVSMMVYRPILSCHCSEKRSNLFCLGFNQKIRPEMQSNTRMMAMPSTMSLPMLPNNSPL
ncbi:Uncharacterised protein [Segatella copri]|nr:Uncharacterised protein [Segatella copri]